MMPGSLDSVDPADGHKPKPSSPLYRVETDIVNLHAAD